MLNIEAIIARCLRIAGLLLLAVLIAMTSFSAYAAPPMCEGQAKAGTACLAKEVWDAIESVAPPGTNVNGKNIDKNLALKIHNLLENGGSAKPQCNKGRRDPGLACGCMQILPGTRKLCLGKNGLPSSPRELYDAMMDENDWAASAQVSVKCASIVVDDHYKGCDNLGAGLCAYRWGSEWCTNSTRNSSGYRQHPEGGANCSSCICGYAITGFRRAGVTENGVIGTNPVTGEPNIQSMSLPAQAGGAGGQKNMEPLNCVDLNLAQNLQMASISYQTGKMAASQQTYNKMMIKDGSACMLKLMTYFDTIGKILSGTISVIGAIVLNVLTQVLTAICDFIVTGINNLLASICIPVPNLGFNLSLPQLQAESCDGISLMNFISVRGSPSGLPPIGFGGYSIPNMALPTDMNQKKPY